MIWSKEDVSPNDSKQGRKVWNLRIWKIGVKIQEKSGLGGDGWKLKYEQDFLVILI